MDLFLAKVTQQAMNYAIRSGITITSGYAIQQCSRLLKTTKSKEKDELQRLQSRLEIKIRIISPAIDMIDLIAARGHTSLGSAVALTKTIRCDIQDLGARLSDAAAEEEANRKSGSKPQNQVQLDMKLRRIILDIKDILEQLEDAVPLISLAITTSGVSLSSNLPPSISPSRLLQASTLLSHGDRRYAIEDMPAVQIGPTFILSMYMLFQGHANRARDEESIRATTWKEVIHKTRLKLVRVPLESLDSFAMFESEGHDTGKTLDRSPSQVPQDQIRGPRVDEFAYQLLIVEDLDDGRFHEEVEDNDQTRRPKPLYDVAQAGIREMLPVHEISKVFYADTGKILNIGSEGESSSPILLIKRDINAAPPRRMVERDQCVPIWSSDEDEGTKDSPAVKQTSSDTEEESKTNSEKVDTMKSEPNMESKHDRWTLPSGLDPEWIAFELFNDDTDSDSDLEGPMENAEKPVQSSPNSRSGSLEPSISTALSKLHLNAEMNSSSPQRPEGLRSSNTKTSLLTSTGPVKISLSLLEMLIRLTSLQQFQQCSHLSVTDELLNFFLEESSTAGTLSGDADARRRFRQNAREKVGFDPYNESPIKKRGETYQYRTSHTVDQDYDDTFSDDGIENVNSSPLLLRSREHSSQSRGGTPTFRANSRPPTSPKSSPPLPRARHQSQSLTTPPSTTKSRQAFLREEEKQDRSSHSERSSPLARNLPFSPEPEGHND